MACVALCTGGRVPRVRARGPQFLDVRVCGVDAVLAMFGRLAACDVTLARTLKVASAVLVIAVSIMGVVRPQHYMLNFACSAAVNVLYFPYLIIFLDTSCD